MALPFGIEVGVGADRCASRVGAGLSMTVLLMSGANAESGLAGETAWSYLSPSVRPFLEQAAKLDQGRSHVFSQTDAVRDKSI